MHSNNYRHQKKTEPSIPPRMNRLSSSIGLRGLASKHGHRLPSKCVCPEAAVIDNLDQTCEARQKHSLQARKQNGYRPRFIGSRFRKELQTCTACKKACHCKQTMSASPPPSICLQVCVKPTVSTPKHMRTATILACSGSDTPSSRRSAAAISSESRPRILLPTVGLPLSLLENPSRLLLPWLLTELSLM